MAPQSPAYISLRSLITTGVIVGVAGSVIVFGNIIGSHNSDGSQNDISYHCPACASAGAKSHAELEELEKAESVGSENGQQQR